MARSSGPFEERVDPVVDAVLLRLAPSWRRGPDRSPVEMVLVRDLDHGLALVLILMPTHLTRDDADGPEDGVPGTRVRLGVGLPAVQDLAALVLAHADLVVVPATPRPLVLRLGDDDEVAAAVDRIVRLVDDETPRLLATYRTPEDLLRHPGPQAEAPPEEDDEDDSYPSLPTDQILLLAVLGHHDEARRLLAEHEPPDDFLAAGRVDHDRRVARQLTRWLDAGGPTPPPADETSPWSSGPSFRVDAGRIWRRHRVDRAVRSAARRHPPGVSREVMRQYLFEAYARRGVHPGRWALGRLADRLLDPPSPTEQFRQVVDGARQLTQLVTDLVGSMKDHELVGEPTWLRPPDRAAYAYGSPGGRERVDVEVDPDAVDYLIRVLEEGRRTVLDVAVAVVSTWIARDPGHDALVVGIGARRVGAIVDADDVAAFDELLHLAAPLDEDLLTAGWIIVDDREPLPFLELPWP